MTPILMSENKLNTHRFNMPFNDEVFIEYLCMVFEDENYSMEELRPFIFDTVIRAVDMYQRRGGTTLLPVYVTQCVKVAVNNFKNQNNL